MNAKFMRAFDRIKFSLFEHFSSYKWAYLIIGLLAILGLIIGLIAGFSNSSNLDMDDIPDSILLGVLQHNISASALLFSRLFSFILTSLLIFLINFRPWLSMIAILIVMYKAFIIGSSCAIIINLFQIGGFINVFIVYLPCNIFWLFALVSWCTICSYHNWETRHYGGCIVGRDFVCRKRAVMLTLIMFIFIVSLIECILLPVFCSAIILS